MRVPLGFSIEDCEQIARIIRSEVEAALELRTTEDASSV